MCFCAPRRGNVTHQYRQNLDLFAKIFQNFVPLHWVVREVNFFQGDTLPLVPGLKHLTVRSVAYAFLDFNLGVVYVESEKEIFF